MDNAVFGTRVASAGDWQAGEADDGPPTLHVAGLAPATVRLAPGEAVRLGAYEYEFVGPRNFAGIAVRKDPGAPLIWIASALFVVGLVVTLWVPRRRVWLHFAADEVRVYSQGRTRGDVGASARDGARIRMKAHGG